MNATKPPKTAKRASTLLPETIHKLSARLRDGRAVEVTLSWCGELKGYMLSVRASGWQPDERDRLTTMPIGHVEAEADLLYLCMDDPALWRSEGAGAATDLGAHVRLLGGLGIALPEALLRTLREDRAANRGTYGAGAARSMRWSAEGVADALSD